LTEAVDKLLLEIVGEVVLGSEKYDAALGDFSVSVKVL
jgi:hypothetical protein